MTGPGILDDLTTQLADFMELPDTLDLPKLYHVQIERKQGDSTWTAKAQLSRYYGAPAWEALRAWHAATGAPVTVSEPSRYGSGKPWRTISVTVSNAALTVAVWAQVDADDPIPAWAQSGRGECLDERIESVRDEAGAVAS